MKYFTIKELCHTNTGIDNTPDKQSLSNLEFLVDSILDNIREEFGKPITVNCGYRNQVVNEKVGGKSNSQHLKGEAVDITSADNETLFKICKKYNFDQLIDEYDLSWIHISLKRSGNRKQILSIK